MSMLNIARSAAKKEGIKIIDKVDEIRGYKIDEDYFCEKYDNAFCVSLMNFNTFTEKWEQYDFCGGFASKRRARQSAKGQITGINKREELRNMAYNLKDDFLKRVFIRHGLDVFHFMVKALKHGGLVFFFGKLMSCNDFNSLPKTDKILLIDIYNFYEA